MTDKLTLEDAMKMSFEEQHEFMKDTLHLPGFKEGVKQANKVALDMIEGHLSFIRDLQKQKKISFQHEIKKCLFLKKLSKSFYLVFIEDGIQCFKKDFSLVAVFGIINTFTQSDKLFHSRAYKIESPAFIQLTELFSYRKGEGTRFLTLLKDFGKTFGHIQTFATTESQEFYKKNGFLFESTDGKFDTITENQVYGNNENEISMVYPTTFDFSSTMEELLLTAQM